MIEWLKTHKRSWLEVVVFLTILGSSRIIHERLIAQGVTDDWTLWIAIIAVDIIIVGAGAWAEAGLVIAVILCAMNFMVAMNIAPGLAPGMFTIAALLGNVGNYARRYVLSTQNTKKAKEQTGLTDIKVNDKGIVDSSVFDGMNVDKLRAAFKLSYSKARKLKKLIDAKQPVHVSLLKG